MRFILKILKGSMRTSQPSNGANHCLISPDMARGTRDYRKFSQRRQDLTRHKSRNTESVPGFFRVVDKILINYKFQRLN